MTADEEIAACYHRGEEQNRPAVVLDVGGGPGAYALWAEVHLASAVVGDARELPQDDAAVDVVLLLGPLYHLQEREDRLRALREAHRVLRPGGLLAVTSTPTATRSSSPPPSSTCPASSKTRCARRGSTSSRCSPSRGRARTSRR